jgi:hypothetical protein
MTEIIDATGYVPVVQPYPEKNTIKVVPPICLKCSNVCPEFKWVTRRTVTKGSLFLALAWHCRKCNSWIPTPKDELELLNKHTVLGGHNVYWPKGELKGVTLDKSGMYG